MFPTLGVRRKMENGESKQKMKRKVLVNQKNISY